MNRLLYSILTIIACAILISCATPDNQGVSVVNGVWERGTPENIRLFVIENGELHQLASSRVGANGEFALAFLPQEEGFFAIGTDAAVRSNIYTFYFKPGDRLNVRITPDGIELTGNNTPENIEMGKWHNFVQPMEVMTDLRRRGMTNHTDFFPLLVQKEAELKNFPRTNTPNRKFNALFERFREVDFLSLALRFTVLPQAVHPTLEDFPDFYRNISIEDLTRDEFLLNFPNGMRELSNAVLSDIRMSGQLGEVTGQRGTDFLVQYPNIQSPVIKGEWVLAQARRNQTLVGLDQYIAQFGHHIVTDSQKERLEALRVALFDSAAASEAFDFSFPDIDGNIVSLSDFKGKVVYIDVWATWCGPCRSEIPHMRRLAAEFEDNQNLVILGVSVDATRDKQKWKEYVARDKQFGVQLFAGDDARRRLMEPYQIRGIPHFILVGKDGRLIMPNAPRPSSSEIRAVLNDALGR